MMPCLTFDEIMGPGEHDFFIMKKYVGVIPEPIDVDAMIRTVPTHCWMVFLVPNNTRNVRMVMDALNSMDTMTFAMNADDDPMHVFAFASKDKRIPWRIRRYFMLKQIEGK